MAGSSASTPPLAWALDLSRTAVCGDSTNGIHAEVA
jgi:hypothetical protein